MLCYLLGRQSQPPEAERLGKRAQELGELRQRNVAAGREGQEAEERGGEGLESAHVIGADRLAAALR